MEYLDWNPEKERYIFRLSEAFSDYVVEAEKASNSYDYVANAMRRWYMALPKYSKESTKKPDGEKLVRRQIEIMKLLRQNSSSSDLLFKKLPEAVDSHGDYADAATDIIAAKTVFDGLLTELKHELIKKTKDAFLPEKDKKAGKKMSLTDAAKEWCDRLDPKSFEQLFSDGTDRFLQHLKSMTNDEDLFITRLAKLATGLRLEDWDSKTIKQYSDALTRFMKTAKDFHTVTELAVSESLEYDMARIHYQFDANRPDLVIVSHASKNSRVKP